MFNTIKNKNGDSSIFQILLCIGILTFCLMFPIISFAYFKFQTSVDDIATRAIKVATTRGGVDEQVMEIIVSEFIEKGYSFDGAVLNGSNNAKVIVRTNTNLCGNGYTFSKNGKSYTIEIRKMEEGYKTTNPLVNGSDYSTYRRYRNGYSSYKQNNTLMTINNGSEIRLELIVPISAHSKMLNALYALITPKNQITTIDKGSVYLDETYGYVVSLSALSELYQESQIDRN